MAPASLTTGLTGTAPGRGLSRRGGPGSVLASAQVALLASRYSGSGDLLDITGHGHNATISGAMFLQPTGGKPYLYLPGISGNNATVPVSDLYRAKTTGTIKIITRIYHGSWRPSAVEGPTGSTLNVVSTRIETNGRIGFMVRNAAGSSVAVSSDAVIPNVAATLLTRVDCDLDSGTATFYTAPDHNDPDTATWTQLGTVQAFVPVGGLQDTAVSVLVVGGTTTSNSHFTGRCFGAWWYENGVLQRAIDFTNLSAYNATRTSLTAVTGQTVTINRVLTNIWACVVDRPLFLGGVDDFLRIADAAGLDFTGTDSLTLLVAGRIYGVSASSSFAGKLAGTPGSNPGYDILAATNSTIQFRTGNAAGAASGNASAAISAGVPFVGGGRRDTTAATVETILNGVSSGTSAEAAGRDLTNSTALDVFNRGAGSQFSIMEFSGMALFRRALIASELTRVSEEFLEGALT